MQNKETPQIDAAQAAAYARLLERLFGERPGETQEKVRSVNLPNSSNSTDAELASDEGSGQ